jgi:uncharacterized cupredoxin-like copper-binding protein
VSGAMTKNENPQTLEEELHELENSSEALDERTGNLETKGGLIMLFTFFAMALAIAALAVSLVNSGGTKTKTVVQAAPPAAATTTPATPAPSSTPAAVHSVSVKLGEMFVRPDVTSATGGKVTFHVQNTGKLVHEMIVSTAPVKVPVGASRASEAGSVGEVSELQPGTSGKVTLSLKPGNYVLFCNVPGHYAAGQHTPFTVKAGR